MNQKCILLDTFLMTLLIYALGMGFLSTFPL